MSWLLRVAVMSWQSMYSTCACLRVIVVFSMCAPLATTRWECVSEMATIRVSSNYYELGFECDGNNQSLATTTSWGCVWDNNNQSLATTTSWGCECDGSNNQSLATTTSWIVSVMASNNQSLATTTSWDCELCVWWQQSIVMKYLKKVCPFELLAGN